MAPMANSTSKEATVEDVPDETDVANPDSWAEVEEPELNSSET